MSTFDNPFDPHRRLRSGCSCGRHASEAEHDRAMAPPLQCTAVDGEDKRYEGVVASAICLRFSGLAANAVASMIALTSAA